MTSRAVILKTIRTLERASRSFQIPIVDVYGKTAAPFKVLVSCMLSLRTRDATTAVASRRLFKKASTPEQLARLPVATIAKLIYPVGFYRTKAKNLKRVAQLLLERHHGNVPDTREELLALPGVGRKTANLVLGVAFKKDAICVDVHCHRIPNRLGWIKTKTPEETEQALMQLLPRTQWIAINGLFVKWGQNICLPLKPWCSRCAIKAYCQQRGVHASR